MARRTNSNTRGVPPSGLGRTSSFHGETATRTRKRSKTSERRKKTAEVPNFKEFATQRSKNKTPATYGGAGGSYSDVSLNANRNFTQNRSVYHRSLNGEDYLVSWSARARAARTAPSLNRASVSQGGSDDSPV